MGHNAKLFKPLHFLTLDRRAKSACQLLAAVFFTPNLFSEFGDLQFCLFFPLVLPLHSKFKVLNVLNVIISFNCIFLE